MQRLTLREGLTAFPREVFALADTLEILDLSGNALTQLPHDLHRLHRLRVLFASGNPFTELPEVLGRCPQLEMVGFKSCQIRHVSAAALPPRLRWLILTDNHLAELPAALGQCHRLQKLMLAGNRLRALPPELAHCHALELLRVSANQLHALPDWLLTLPRLSWLAFAGNPFCAEAEAQALQAAPVPVADWADLQLGPVLGEGASGVIHRAEWRQPDRVQAVALKLFKGAVTSDGLPDSEMAASLQAGKHPHLIGVQAQLQGHPQGRLGLVMPLVDAAFGNLAQPPSLDSCTRDIYPADTRFEPPQILVLAQGVVRAVRHLHARGVLLGDVYGHNLLHHHGRVLLGDFGAASLLASVPAAQRTALQQLEMRALGVFLDELLERSTDPTHPALAPLVTLHDACWHPQPTQRFTMTAQAPFVPSE